MRLFIFGIGYTARALIDAHRDLFSHISGTVRTPDKAKELTKQGINAHVFAHANSALVADIIQADAILSSIPPGPGGDPALALVPNHCLRLRACWVGYLSTVGVYGDHAGAWVDEKSPTLTRHLRSQHRLIAEAQWRGVANTIGARDFTFRLPGIYGPRRNSLCDIVNGTARHIVKVDQVFNRAHVDDITASIIATLTEKTPPGVYNITDDEPASQGDMVTYAAGIMGVKPPSPIPFEIAELSEMARSFYLENKRVSNAKIRALPGFKLAYPTYREGLAVLLQAGEGILTR